MFCPCWSQTLIFPVAASWVAGITDVSHWTLPQSAFLNNNNLAWHGIQHLEGTLRQDNHDLKASLGYAVRTIKIKKSVVEYLPSRCQALGRVCSTGSWGQGQVQASFPEHLMLRRLQVYLLASVHHKFKRDTLANQSLHCSLGFPSMLCDQG
jgi:hypothetical protein